MKIKVKPNSKQEGIEKIDEDFYLVKLKKPAKEGKANQELIRILKKYFKKSIRIKRGLRSRNKIIEFV